MLASRTSNAKNVRLALLASAIAVLTVPGQVNAQTTPTPSRPVTDELGVDLATGTISATSKDVSIGNLSFENIWGGSVDETTFTNAVLVNVVSGVVFIDGKSILFVRQPDDIYKPELANGATLKVLDSGGMRYVAPDGTRYEFVLTPPTEGGGLTNFRGSGESWFRLSQIVSPNGEIRTFNYRQASAGTNCSRFNPNLCASFTDYIRLQSVTTNTGLMLKANYATNTPGPDFSKLTSVQAINRAVDFCDPDADTCTNLTQSWPTMSISVSTDPNGNQQKLLSTLGGDFVARISATGLLAVNSDNQNNDGLVVTRYPNGMLYQVSVGGRTTTYSYARSGDQLTVTRTQPNNIVETFVIRSSSALPTRLESKTDELNNTTTYGYDSENRLYLVTAPEGDATQTSHDPIGRIVEVRNKVKPGSGLPDLVSTAGYVPNCTVDDVKYCMKPVWTQDVRGNRTDITYSNDHGEATRVQLPAPTAGAPRPEINATYAPFYAKVRNAAGALVDADSPVWKLTRQTRCASAATCAGSASEQVTALEYAASGGGLNLLPTKITVSAGDGSVSSSVDYTYDTADNLIAADGPLPGSDDKVHYFWDADQRLIGIIGADPDGAGARLRRAERYVYTGDNLVRTETGTTNGTDRAALDAMTVVQSVESTYDANDYKVAERVVSAGTTYALTQFSYDTLGQLECTALRMNPATFGALPATACALGAAGAAGQDRIVRRVYDPVGRVKEVQSAYGTADQTSESIAYTANGQQLSVTDGNGNKTTYRYDGHDRIDRTFYPSPTTPGVSSTTDWVGWGYGATGTLDQYRLRDGQVLIYDYDALGQTTRKRTWQSGVGIAGTTNYTFDLLGRPTTIAKGGTYTPVNFTYDALGRTTSEGRSPSLTARFDHDAAGRLTRLTYFDGFFVTYDYDITGNMTAVRENGTTELATYAYDDLGRRTSLTRGNGTVTSYSFDPVSRLTSLGQSFASSGNNVTASFTHHPSGQIASVTRSNDAYAWTGATNVDRPYSVNGLNQLTASGNVSLGYDARGNLTSSGGSSYRYDSDNLLTEADGLVYYYDSVGRLRADEEKGYDYAGDKLLRETEAGGRTVSRYVWGAGSDAPLVWYNGFTVFDRAGAIGQRNYLHADERGSIIAVSNASGTVTNINSYDEYGIPAAGNVGRFQYTGQAWLPELGMYYYKARIYSPTLGRFLQTDPIGYADGLNWYNYVGSDPVNATDPSGLGACNQGSLQGAVQATDYNRTSPSCPSQSEIDAARARALAALGVDVVVTERRAPPPPPPPTLPPTSYTPNLSNLLAGLPPGGVFEAKGRDRGRTARPDGTKNPNKKIKRHPTRPGWVIDSSRPDGKSFARPARLGEPGYIGPPANFDAPNSYTTNKSPVSTVPAAAGLALAVLLVGIVIILSPVGL